MSPPNDLEALVSQTLLFAERSSVMPIEEIELSVAFAELPDPHATIARLLERLLPHDNLHVRRVALNACRRIGEFEAPGLKEALVAALEDPAGWVRYDAAWALRDAGFRDEAVVAALERAADGAKYPEDEDVLTSNRGDSKNMARLEAAKALHALRSAE